MPPCSPDPAPRDSEPTPAPDRPSQGKDGVLGMTLREELARRLASFTIERWQNDRARRLETTREESSKTEPYYDIEKMVEDHLAVADEVIRQMKWTHISAKWASPETTSWETEVLEDGDHELKIAPPDWKP